MYFFSKLRWSPDLRKTQRMDKNPNGREANQLAIYKVLRIGTKVPLGHAASSKLCVISCFSAVFVLCFFTTEKPREKESQGGDELARHNNSK